MAIQKLLVANRGEIAARIFRACREAGIGTVAVAAPDDLGAFHTRHADETVEIQSYLFSEEHIRAAKKAGADAIHPGYGFLAENPDFAEAVEAAGLALRRADAGGAAPRRRQARGEADRGRGRSSDPARRRAGRDRLPARGQGGCRRRWPRDAGRPRSGRARGRDRGRPARGEGRVRRRPRLLRALRRAAAPRRDPAPRRRARNRPLARRARVLDPAPPSEGARGVALACARPRAARRA